MKKGAIIEVIMKAQFLDPSLLLTREEQVEKKALSAKLLFILAGNRVKYQPIFLQTTREMVDFSLS